MKFQTKHITYQERLKKEFVVVFLILSGIMLYSAFDKSMSYVFAGFSILMTGLVLLLYVNLRAAIYFNGITFSENKIILNGFEVNTPIEVQLPIEQTKIVIKVEASNTGNHQYYLLFKHNSKKYAINRLHNWNYQDVVDIFNCFKEAKGEKIIIDEKLVLNRIQEKIAQSQ